MVENFNIEKVVCKGNVKMIFVNGSECGKDVIFQDGAFYFVYYQNCFELEFGVLYN